jgi:threonyl-tRNA synthetase
LPEDKTITVYRCGPLVDLCRGPHIPNTSFVKAFACLKVFFLFLSIELQVLLMIFGTSDLILSVNIRLQHLIGEEKQTVRACREYMESLSLILNVSRYII